MRERLQNKKILVSAFIGSRNLGDEAIFKSILYNLAVDKKHITALSINEEKTQKLGVNTLFAKKIRNIVKGIRSCDIMLVGGGGIIQDQSSILNFLYYAFQLYVAKHYKKPVILCFVGVGPLNFKISKWILRRLTPHISYAVVRDEKSRLELQKHGMESSKIYQAHDPVLNFPFSEEELANDSPTEKPYAVLALRRWFFTISFLPVFVTRKINKFKMFRKKYERFMLELSRDIDEYLDKHKDMKIVAVSFYDGEDDVVNADLVSLLKNKEQVILAPTSMSENQYLSIVRNSEFIIGMRLHSLILGSLLAKPFVALRYSPKVDEFTKQMGQTDLSIHVERYNSNMLQKALDGATRRSPKLHSEIQNKLVDYQKKNKKAFAALNETIESLLKNN